MNQDKKNFIQRTRSLPLWKRITLSIILLLIWFSLMYYSSVATGDPVRDSTNFQGFWIASPIVFLIVVSVFFERKR